MARMARIARRVLESTIQGALFISEHRLFFKSIEGTLDFFMQTNNQNRPCKVELEFPKIVFFYQFFKSIEGTLDFFMQQNDIVWKSFSRTHQSYQ